MASESEAQRSFNWRARLLGGVAAGIALSAFVLWDDWGFVFGSNDVYLVFDPDDILATALSGPPVEELPGIPCSVPIERILRLERHWLSVQFYSDVHWDYCGYAK